MGKQESWWIFPGFEIEVVATGLDLPVNLAFVPNPKDDAKAPLFYVTELFGQIRVITNDWTMYTYAHNLLNYQPEHQFPGSGESGVTGICVEPKTGDLFVSMIYMDNDETKGKVIRMSSQNGLETNSVKTIIDDIPSTTKAHQVQAVSIGFDGKLYVNIGDGGEYEMAQVDNDLRGKILRMNLDGTIPSDNPNPRSYVFAKGFRNPFGAAWRTTDQSLYVSINGPDRDDVVARVKPGNNHGWPQTMRENALFWWEYPQAPTALAFMQDGQFPDEFHDDLFVALFGNSYKKGRDVKGKKIVKMKLNAGGYSVTAYDEFATYIGDEAAAPCGLAFGPGGMYFSDLHGESNGLTGKPSGSIYRVKAIKKMATASLRGMLLAKSEEYEMVESNVYFPPSSVNWQYFTKSGERYKSPVIGEAFFFDISIEGYEEKNAAWSFPEPKTEFKHIKDYVAFGYGQVDLLTERTG
jgi:glucose/arabinose dehydrogenase